MPAAVIGASIGQIGTAVAQQSLRGAELLQCPPDDRAEAYVYFRPEVYSQSGEVTDGETAAFLRTFMQEFRTHVERVLTVIPRTDVRYTSRRPLLVSGRHRLNPRPDESPPVNQRPTPASRWRRRGWRPRCRRR